MLDFGIVLVYFVVIFAIALAGRLKETGTAEDYFLSSDNNELNRFEGIVFKSE